MNQQLILRAVVGIASALAGGLTAYVLARPPDPAKELARLDDELAFLQRVEPRLREDLQEQFARNVAVRAEEEAKLGELRGEAPPKLVQSPGGKLAPTPVETHAAPAATSSNIIEKGKFRSRAVRKGGLDSEQMLKLEHLTIETMQAIDQGLERLANDPPALTDRSLVEAAQGLQLEAIARAEERFLATLPPEQRKSLVESDFSLFEEIDVGAKVSATVRRLKERSRPSGEKR